MVASRPSSAGPSGYSSAQLRREASTIKTLASTISQASLLAFKPEHNDDIARQSVRLDHESRQVARKTMVERERELRDMVTARCRTYDQQRLVLNKKESRYATLQAEVATMQRTDAGASAASAARNEALAAQRRTELAAEVERAEEAMGEATGYSESLSMMTERLLQENPAQVSLETPQLYAHSPARPPLFGR